MASIKSKIVFPSGDEVIVNLDGKLRIVEHFRVEEVANTSSKEDIKLVLASDMIKFLEMVEEFRKWFNKSMKVNSCFRTKSFNTACGGSPNSAHLHGCAMDWGISGHTEQQRRNVRNKWEEVCKAHGNIGAINFYTHGYHLEAFSDKILGAKSFQVREYRGRKGDW